MTLDWWFEARYSRFELLLNVVMFWLFIEGHWLLAILVLVACALVQSHAEVNDWDVERDEDDL